MPDLCRLLLLMRNLCYALLSLMVTFITIYTFNAILFDKIWYGNPRTVCIYQFHLMDELKLSLLNFYSTICGDIALLLRLSFPEKRNCPTFNPHKHLICLLILSYLNYICSQSQNTILTQTTMK